MNNYLLQGKYPLRMGVMQNCPDPADQGVLLSWGFWTEPEASNDDNMDEPPGRA